MHQIALQNWVDFGAQEGDWEEKSSQYRHPQNILQDPVNFRAQGGDQRGSERMNLCRISLLLSTLPHGQGQTSWPVHWAKLQFRWTNEIIQSVKLFWLCIKHWLHASCTSYMYMSFQSQTYQVWAFGIWQDYFDTDD